MATSSSFPHTNTHLQLSIGSVLSKVVPLVIPIWVSFVLIVISPNGITRDGIRIQVVIYACSVIYHISRWLIRRQYVREIGWGFLLIGSATWFAIPALSVVLTPNLWFGDWIGKNIDIQSLFSAGIAVSVFLLTNFVGYTLARPRPHTDNHVPSKMLIRNFDRVTVTLLMLSIGLIPYVAFGVLALGFSETLSQLISGRVVKAWSLGQGADAYSGSSISTIFWLARASLVTSGVLAGCYFQLRSLKLPERMFYLLVIVLVFFILYFDQGTRSVLGLFFIPIAVFFLLHMSQSMKSFRTPKLILIASVVAILGLVVTQAQMFYREERTRSSLSSLSIVDLISPRQQTDFFTETALAMTVRDSILNRNLEESPLFHFVVNPIPRFLWKDKPLSYTVWYYTLFRWGTDIWERGGNALPSVVGQYYMNWSWPGIVWIGILFGVIAASTERIIRKFSYLEGLVLSLSIFSFLVLSYRNFAPGMHYAPLVLAVVLAVYSKFPRSESLTK